MSPRERRLVGAELPVRIADLPEPPLELFVCGDLPRGPAVAIVGTRSPTPGALVYTRRLAATLARAGVAILSGGAVGIDGAAHEGALEVGGCSVVVAPCGFDRPYPPGHAALFRAVVERGGAYLSLVARDVPASRAAFFPRNALLVALAHVVIVVEAPARSGARNAAAVARRIGRPLLVAPAAPWNPRGSGAAIELRLGAKPLGSPRQVLRLLGDLGVHPIALPPRHPDPVWRAASLSRARACERAAVRASASAPAREAGSAPDQQKDPPARPGVRSPDPDPACPAELPDYVADPAAVRVVEAVRAGAANEEEICARAGLGASRVQQLLLTLTLEGVLVPDLGGRFRIQTN